MKPNDVIVLADTIAAIIREVDGGHTLGAGELAEAIASRLPVEMDRMAAIGRVVVGYAHPDNPRAVKEATPELVLGWLRRRDAEHRATALSHALRVGRLVLDLDRALADARKA